jgi:hypothetical protein
MTRTQAKHDERVAAALADLPVVAAAHRAGRIGREKVLALVEVRTPELEAVIADQQDVLVEEMARLRVAEVRRFLRAWQEKARLMVGWTDPDAPIDDTAPRVALDLSPTAFGRWVLDAEMDAEHGQIVANAIGAEVDEMFRVGVFSAADGLTPAERRGQALVNLLTRRALPKMRNGAPVPSIEVICDEKTLLGLPIDGVDDLRTRVLQYASGDPLGLATLGRYLCGARLHRLVIDADGEVLDAGKDVRLANRAQKRALAFRHARHCGFPGCDAPAAWCEGHHIDPYDPDPAHPGGRTDMANLIPLCRYHHHRVHEGGFTLVMTPDGEVTAHRPPDPVTGERCPVTPSLRHRREVEPTARSA